MSNLWYIVNIAGDLILLAAAVVFVLAFIRKWRRGTVKQAHPISAISSGSKARSRSPEDER